MKKSLLFTFMLVCLITLGGCKHHEIYRYTGSHEYLEINDCYFEIYEDRNLLEKGTLKILNSDKFKNIISCTMKHYLLFDDGYQYPLGSSTIEDKTYGIDLHNFKIGNSEDYNSARTHIFKNPDASLWFELETIDINGVENVYKIPLTLTQ